MLQSIATNREKTNGAWHFMGLYLDSRGTDPMRPLVHITLANITYQKLK